MLPKQTSYTQKENKKKKYNSVKLFDYASYSMLLYSAAERDRERINR